MDSMLGGVGSTVVARDLANFESHRHFQASRTNAIAPILTSQPLPVL